jgi:nucleoside-diphosphate-sugar epimerase
LILVTGGAGVMGSRLVKELIKKGYKVRVLALPGEPNVKNLEGTDCEIVYGDVSKMDTIKDIFENVSTVFHLAAIIISNSHETIRNINFLGTKNVLECSLNAGVGHFIYISSVSAVWPEGSFYARSKHEAEMLVLSCADRIRYTIVRPTLTYGPGEGQEFMMFAESLKKYPFVFLVGNGSSKKNPVLADDLVKGLAEIIDNPESLGKIYNFSGGEEISIKDLAKLLCQYQDISRLFVQVPVWLCRIIAFVMEKTMKKPLLTQYGISRMLQEASTDNSPARADLGYSPVGIKEGLEICNTMQKYN